MLKNGAFQKINTDKVLISVAEEEWCYQGIKYAERFFENMEIFRWNMGDQRPDRILDWEGDWIISYRGDYIFPEKVFKRAKKGAINFHPAPPKYRGTGCQYHAIYNGDETYGSTCHHLAKVLDTGPIIDVERFTLSPGETASSLRYQLGVHCLSQFLRILSEYVIPGNPLPTSDEKWGEILYKKADVDEWLLKVRETEPSHPCLQ